jgi:hypothetical protein
MVEILRLSSSDSLRMTGHFSLGVKRQQSGVSPATEY